MQKGVRQHAFTASPVRRGAVGSSLLLPAVRVTRGGLQRGPCLSGDHQVAITTQKRTPSPRGPPGAAGFPARQVTTLGWPVPPAGPQLGHPSVVPRKIRTSCELQTQHQASQGKRKADEGAQPACRSSTAWQKVAENTLRHPEEITVSLTGGFFLVLPADLRGALRRSTGLLSRHLQNDGSSAKGVSWSLWTEGVHCLSRDYA